MSLFWKCSNCNNKSFFFVKSYGGLCENCYEEKRKNEQKARDDKLHNEIQPKSLNASEAYTVNAKINSFKPNYKVPDILIEPLDVFDNSLLVYVYKNCEVCIIKGTEQEVFENDFSGLNNLYFDSEPENPCDPSAVIIKHGSNKIGYVYKGQFQDMINDWLQRDHHIFANISEVDYTNHKIFYQLTFYKPFDSLEHKTFSLIKMNSKDWLGESRYDNATGLTVGDVVDICFDGVDSPCVVKRYSSEVGELNQAAKEYINSLVSRNREVIGVVEEVRCDGGIDFMCNISIYNRRPL